MWTEDPQPQLVTALKVNSIMELTQNAWIVHLNVTLVKVKQNIVNLVHLTELVNQNVNVTSDSIQLKEIQHVKLVIESVLNVQNTQTVLNVTFKELNYPNQNAHAQLTNTKPLITHANHVLTNVQLVKVLQLIVLHVKETDK